MNGRITTTELAQLLSCSKANVHDTADRIGIPHDLRHSVRTNGTPYTYRVYLRGPVLAALDEIGRHTARKAAS